MNMQSILSRLSTSQGHTVSGASRGDGSGNATNSVADGGKAVTSPLEGLSSLIPGGLAGGAAAGGIMALLMGSKSTRKMVGKVAKLGGTAVLGGLAYKAYDNWQQNKALGQTKPVSDHDIEQANQAISVVCNDEIPLTLVLIKTMIAAAKADGNIDAQEHQRLFDAVEKMGLNADEKAAVFDLMTQNISINDIADSVSDEEHKAEVYLSAYLSIEVDNQDERAFLNNLAMALKLPKGLPAYLEQQADQGVAA